MLRTRKQEISLDNWKNKQKKKLPLQSINHTKNKVTERVATKRNPDREKQKIRKTL